MQAMMDMPDMVRQVHDEYFAAGAEIATTNTYAILLDRLEPKGLGEYFQPMNRSACEMAVAARDAHGSGEVAGSLGPQGFSYQPDKSPPAEQAAEVYADIARLHADYVDFHLLETMSSVDQARGGLMGAGFQPYGALGASGQQQQQREQSLIQDAMSQQEFEQNLPYQQLQQYQSGIAGFSPLVGGAGQKVTTQPGRTPLENLGSLASMYGLF